MKTLMAFAFASALIFTTQFAAAQVTVTFDENGNGTANGSKMGFTTGPLRYQFPGGGVVPGDVVVTENVVGTNQTDSDLLRFDANGGITVFSDLEAGETNPDLADIPVTAFPTPAPGFLTFAETAPGGGPAIEGGVNGLFGYMPGPAMPGGLPTGAPITYNFFSDVPEPASMSLIGVGAWALLFRRRRPA